MNSCAKCAINYFLEVCAWCLDIVEYVPKESEPAQIIIYLLKLEFSYYSPYLDNPDTCVPLRVTFSCMTH